MASAYQTANAIEQAFKRRLGVSGDHHSEGPYEDENHIREAARILERRGYRVRVDENSGFFVRKQGFIITIWARR